VAELASYLRIAQYLLIALAVSGFLYAIYRFVWRHLKPLPLPEIHGEGPSIDEVPVQVTPAPIGVRRRKRRATR
jgi:hypothetical protein